MAPQVSDAHTADAGCAELKDLLNSGPDGGDCPPVGPCRGFEGNCADLPAQFAAVPVLPDWPDGLADYTCHAFPDDDNQVDAFLVGLIAIAVALPVSSFIAQCFGIANDSEAPESLLEWSGWPKLVFGPTAHRRWLYSGPAGPPRRFVKWYVRSAAAPQPETLINLWHSFRCWLTGAELPWVTEWREAQEEAQEAAAEHLHCDDAANHAQEDPLPQEHDVNGHCDHWTGSDSLQVDQELNDSGSEYGGTVVHVKQLAAWDEPAGVSSNDLDEDSDGVSTSSSVRSAQSLSTYKRVVVLAGFVGTYITWALFAWFIFTYGMLIYKLLGDQAQSEFARSWGISYAMNAVTEWKDIAVEAVKATVIMIILERLFLTRNSAWLEEHMDYLSIQALLFKRGGLSTFQQTRLFFRYTKRLA